MVYNVPVEVMYLVMLAMHEGELNWVEFPVALVEILTYVSISAFGFIWLRYLREQDGTLCCMQESKDGENVANSVVGGPVVAEPVVAEPAIPVAGVVVNAAPVVSAE